MAKIVIIGAGVTGLSAGIYAQRNGHTAVVCDRQSVAGGNLTGWQRGEYHIDNCIHWLTGTNPCTKAYEIWMELGALGGKIKLHRPNTLYTYEKEGVCLSLYRDLEKTKAEWLSACPSDEKEIYRFFKGVQVVQRYCDRTENTQKQYNFGLFIAAMPYLAYFFGKNTGELAKRFRHTLSRGFVTAMLGKDFSALALLGVFATFCGGNGDLPQGGSLAMAQRIADMLQSLGGTLLLNKEAVKIEVKTDKNKPCVHFSDGECMECDYVVVTAEPAVAYKKLLRMPMPASLQKAYHDPEAYRFSAYQCAFACDKNCVPFEGDFIYPLSKGERKLLGAENMILRSFRHESDFAPKGKTVLQSLVFCDERASRQFIRLRQDTAKYQAKKAALADVIAQSIKQKFSASAHSLQVLDVWTPATYHRYTDAEVGSFMGFIWKKRTVPKALRVDLVREHVFFAGQWLQSPGGLPIAAKEGRDIVERICKQERMRIR